jgi:hypothetical protein
LRCGIKAISWTQAPWRRCKTRLEAAFKTLDADIIEAYQLDLKDFLQFTTK